MAQKQYQGRNIELRKLKKITETWFRDQQYETQSKSGDRDFLIQARKGGTFRTIVGASRAFNITISGSPNDFSVNFSIGDWSSNLAAIGIGTLLTGGLFLIGSGLAAGWSKKIEADFLSWMDNTVQFSSRELLADASQIPDQNLSAPAVNEKLEKLRAAFEAGILSEQEFNDKVGQLKTDTSPSDQMDKLNDAFRAGILTETEYKAKKSGIEKNLKLQNLSAALSNGILTQMEYDKKVAEFDEDVEFID